MRLRARWMLCGQEFAGGEEAGVGALAEGDAGIVAELLGDLAVAGVDGEDGGGAALQHAVGEAAGGGADVDAGEAGEVDGPVGEGVLELEAAAADVFEVGAEEAEGGVGEMEVPGLSTRCSSTRTRPARMRAWARSREAAWPWSTRSLSRRIFSGRIFSRRSLWDWSFAMALCRLLRELSLSVHGCEWARLDRDKNEPKIVSFRVKLHWYRVSNMRGTAELPDRP